MGELVFQCQRAGFESAVGTVLLGGFDGRDDRVLNVHEIADRDEQIMVSAHEQMHHELQWSTAWGVFAAMSGLLADAGVRSETLGTIASGLNTAARQVHETFATCISAGIFGIDRGLASLKGNDIYLAHLRRGLDLAGPPEWPWQFRESAIQMLLRSLMQPAEIVGLAEAGFGKARLRDLPPPGAYPDERLRVVAEHAQGWWAEAFHDLIIEHPERGGDTGDEWSRNLPDEIEAMNTMKLWEETVLIPRLQEVATTKMRSLGYEVLDGGLYLQLVEALRASLAEHGPDDWQIKVLTGPRALHDEPLGAEREALQFRNEPFPVEIIEEDAIVPNAELFLGTEFTASPHVFAMYGNTDIYRHQFQGMDWLPTQRPALLSLIGPVRDNGRSKVPLAMLQPTVTPSGLQDMFTSLPVLTITTLSTTRERENQANILDLDRSFIIIDQPLKLQIEQWAKTGWTTRFAATALKSDRPLNRITFAIDELPQCLFLAFRSETGFGELAQLLDTYKDQLRPNLELDDVAAAQINAVTTQLLNSWWVFRETGWS